jgi:hypothetical protein
MGVKNLLEFSQASPRQQLGRREEFCCIGFAPRVWKSNGEERALHGFDSGRRRFLEFCWNETVRGRFPLNYIPVRSAFGVRIGPAMRALLFTLECALGVLAVVLVSALAHWFGGLLSVSVLLYLLIVVPTALLSGFRQAVIVSLSAVIMQGYFTAHQPPANLAVNPASWVVLLAFVLVALVISRLSARVARHAEEAESWSEQVRDLYEFTRRTLEMNLHLEPGGQLAELAHEIFALEAVAVFDAELHKVYSAGYWRTPTTSKPRMTIRKAKWAGAWCGSERRRLEAWWCAAAPVR